MKITASVVTYRTSAEDLMKVVSSAMTDGVEKLYVIDHTPDGGCRNIVPNHPDVIYIKHENTGYGAGHNVALRQAMEEGVVYHAVLNPDIYWTDPVIKTLAGYMDTHTDVGQMMPRVLYPDGRLQYTCKLIPTPLDLVTKRFLPDWMTRRRMSRFQLEESGYDHIVNVPYMHGCFMMLRLEALRDVGLFDERFFMYPEDIDLTRRIHARWKTLFYPYVTLFHAHAAASRHSLRMLGIHISNMVRYFNKWGWFIDTERRRVNRRLLSEIRQTPKCGSGDGV